jgi:hypothetical protein
MKFDSWKIQTVAILPGGFMSVPEAYESRASDTNHAQLSPSVSSSSEVRILLGKTHHTVMPSRSIIPLACWFERTRQKQSQVQDRDLVAMKSYANMIAVPGIL